MLHSGRVKAGGNEIRGVPFRSRQLLFGFCPLLEITLERCFESSGITPARVVWLQSLPGVPPAQAAQAETAAASATASVCFYVSLKNDAEKLRVAPQPCVFSPGMGVLIRDSPRA